MRRPTLPRIAVWLFALVTFIGLRGVPLHLHQTTDLAGDNAPVAIAHSIFLAHSAATVAAASDHSHAQVLDAPQASGGDSGPQDFPAASIDLALLALIQQIADTSAVFALIALTVTLALLRRPPHGYPRNLRHLFFRHWSGAQPPPLRAPPL